ncbi:hypothetical protein [Anaerostipes sp.]|uniref:hypothetical protein n=1 Tax=Anaerostipes sp. TaxID=1872530 RepID=UPI0025C03808|nr:hypothetical protein [Anaerostipes sp.]MBS7007317.1 hypothetical protein [Anaerostipes sp.]
MNNKKNTMLKVMSIILLIAGLLNAFSNISLLTSDKLMNLAMEQVNKSSDILTVYFAVGIIFGLFEIICCFYGLRASKHYRMSETCFKLAVGLLIAAVITFGFNIYVNGFIMSTLGGFVFPLLYLISIKFYK